MINFGAVSLEWGTMLMQLIFVLPTLLFYAFLLYALVQALRFMKSKKQQDEERNRKLDQLIRMLEKREKQE